MTERVLLVRSALLILRRRAASLAHAAIKEHLDVMALVHEVRHPRYPSTNQSLPSSAPFAGSDKPSTREPGVSEGVALSDEVGPVAAAMVRMTQTVFR